MVCLKHERADGSEGPRRLRVASVAVKRLRSHYGPIRSDSRLSVVIKVIESSDDTHTTHCMWM